MDRGSHCKMTVIIYLWSYFTCFLGLLCMCVPPPTILSVCRWLLLFFPLPSLLALLTARGDLLAMLTWPLLTLALCYSQLILLIRAQSAQMWEPRCVIRLLALQSLGTRDVCRSHTGLGMVLCCWLQ